MNLTVSLILSFSVVFLLVESANADSSRAARRNLRKAMLEQQQNQDYSLKKALSTISIKKLQKSIETLQASESNCDEKRQTPNSARFVTTYDGTGRPCKLYDLSFPTLQTLFAKKAVSTIPVEQFSSEDYWNWYRGNFDKVIARYETAKTKNISPEDLDQFWGEGVDFERLPQSARGGEFSLADIVPSGNFQWDQQTNQLFNQLRPFNRDPFLKSLMNDPYELMENTKLKWDPLKKAYEVFISFDFLPLKGPISLVDYNNQYALGMQSLIRYVLETSIVNLAQFIPAKTPRRIVQVVFSDVFTALDHLYNYQITRLKETLKANKANKVPTKNSPQLLEQSLNLLYASGTDVFSQILVNFIQTRELDLGNIEELGEQAQFTEQKVFRSNKGRIHNSLVKDKGCDTEIIMDHYAVCRKDGGRQGVYSLLSESSLGFYNMGATQLYDYSFPAKRALFRSLSYMLSAGIRIWSPLGYMISFSIADVFKTYAFAGVQDEAIFLQRIENGNVDPRFENPFESKVINWVQSQNMNPLIPRSSSATESIIQKNQYLLDQITNKGAQGE
jgi:hypothetical protein